MGIRTIIRNWIDRPSMADEVLLLHARITCVQDSTADRLEFLEDRVSSLEAQQRRCPPAPVAQDRVTP